MMQYDDSKGIAYLFVLILVLVITVSGLAFVHLGELEDRLFLEESRSTQAQFVAEGGIRRVGWALRNLATLNPDTVNPFHENWYVDPAQPLNVTDLLDLVNPSSGETFSPDSRSAYYLVAGVTGAMSEVRIRVLGAVDKDGDGAGGIGDWDGDGYPDLIDADAQDTTRFFEVFMGLPGTLGHDVAIAAEDLLDRYGNPVALNPSGVISGLAMQTTKGHHLDDFWFFNRVSGNDFKEIFSNRIILENSGNQNLQGQVELPRGLFLANGTPDMDYFAGLPIRIYDGNQTFSPETADPTAGRPAGEIIWVNGNIFLNVESSSPWDGIDLENDWERSDVVLVATGDIRAVNLSCGLAGRVVLVAKNIDLEYWKLGDQINGIAVASGDIRLEATNSSNERDVRVDDDFPTYQASYFYGTLLAGDNIRLNHGGWIVIFDQNVINGIMGLQPPPMALDRFEGGGLSSCWTSSGVVAEVQQGEYLQDEIDNEVGDYRDGGGDGEAEVLRITMRPLVNNSGMGDVVEFFLDGSQGGDCTALHQDWRDYGALQFYMALDNYRRVAGLAGGNTLSTEREAQFSILILDSDTTPNTLHYQLNEDTNSAPCTGSEYIYSESSWGSEPYDLSSGDVTDPTGGDDYQSLRLPRWEDMDLPFSCFEGDVGTFDYQDVREIQLQFNSVELRWALRDPDDNILHWREVRSTPSGFVFDKRDVGNPQLGPQPVLREPSDGHFYYVDPNSGNPEDILWDADGDGGEDELMREEDLISTLRVDRILLPGVSRLNYGLPPFSLEVSRWRELSRNDVGF